MQHRPLASPPPLDSSFPDLPNIVVLNCANLMHSYAEDVLRIQGGFSLKGALLAGNYFANLGLKPCLVLSASLQRSLGLGKECKAHFPSSWSILISSGESSEDGKRDQDDRDTLTRAAHGFVEGRCPAIFVDNDKYEDWQTSKLASLNPETREFMKVQAHFHCFYGFPGGEFVPSLPLYAKRKIQERLKYKPLLSAAEKAFPSSSLPSPVKEERRGRRGKGGEGGMLLLSREDHRARNREEAGWSRSRSRDPWEEDEVDEVVELGSSDSDNRKTRKTSFEFSNTSKTEIQKPASFPSFYSFPSEESAPSLQGRREADRKDASEKRMVEKEDKKSFLVSILPSEIYSKPCFFDGFFSDKKEPIIRSRPAPPYSLLKRKPEPSAPENINKSPRKERYREAPRGDSSSVYAPRRECRSMSDFSSQGKGEEGGGKGGRGGWQGDVGARQQREQPQRKKVPPGGPKRPPSSASGSQRGGGGFTLFPGGFRTRLEERRRETEQPASFPFREREEWGGKGKGKGKGISYIYEQREPPSSYYQSPPPHPSYSPSPPLTSSFSPPPQYPSPLVSQAKGKGTGKAKGKGKGKMW